MTTNKHSIGTISGSNNAVYNGTTIINEAPKPQQGIMYNLLSNIASMISSRKVTPEVNDNSPYSISEKIKFNDIKKYLDFEDYYDDGLHIIDERLRIIEDSSIGNIKPQIFRYVQNCFIALKSANSNDDSNSIVSNLEKNITDELRNYYKNHLTPEDLSHVQFVIYYVFASCKIFDKPTKEFIANVNS